MALIPGTLPNDTCYGTPQDLLELFAQYLDVPAFALNSKVVFGTSSVGLTADVVWFDTTAPTNPILKITVSGGFTDYIKNYITSAATVTIVGADSILILDASDSGNTKKGLVSDITPAAGSITPAQLAQPFSIGTSVLTQTVSSVDFTSIPSWVKRITVMYAEVSTNGTSPIVIKLGTSAGIQSTSYVGCSWRSNTVNAQFSTGFSIMPDLATSSSASGVSTIVLYGSNNWNWSSVIGDTGGTNVAHGGGTKDLSGTLDRIRLTTVGGSDTFDTGKINILFE
jgi:hypothetical protein